MNNKLVKTLSLSLFAVVLFLGGATEAFATAATKTDILSSPVVEKSSIPHTLNGELVPSERPNTSLFQTRWINYFHPTTTINVRTAPNTGATIVECQHFFRQEK